MPFSEIKCASTLVLSKLLKIINKVTKNGTLKNIPTTPQSFPITERRINIIRGLILSDLPINFGSRKLPTIICTNVSEMKMNSVIEGFKNCIKEKIVGIIIDIIEPRNGIKLKKKARNANNMVKSLWNKFKTKSVSRPVKKLVKNLI